ncbi:Flp pilus assembly protein CpaB [Paracoccus sp. S-4012]|uniref:Flp pilus assembly protein CpaB n=1 Tax=Paracoccus sp. S-4012 TaxID=2665648 RepID=UPI0012B0F54D|nr:Flp pilus assembly protein CpaB [Paracoccus sp. S-4012]MRX51757.1 Flp pilus assembly protein CpaB [Paracoccus sp. S-4012]
MLRIAIFALALMSGGAAAWLSTGSDPVSAEAAFAAPAPVDHVLVAAADLAPGTRIDAAALRWQPWPQDGLTESYVTQATKPDAPDAFTGMTVRSPIMSGEPVHPGKLAADDGGLLSVMLSQGKRAVAVRISADTTAGGFILPNDSVDVLHTRLRQGTDGQADASSRAILRKIRVLAIDQTVDADTGSVVGKTATLELSPQEAETIVAAEADGAITLALRAASDIDEPEPERAPEPDPEPADEVLVQQPAFKSVRVFRGTQQEIVELGR